MEQKIIVFNVSTFDENSHKIDALSIEKCSSQKLACILQLCKKDYEVTVSFRELDMVPDDLR